MDIYNRAPTGGGWRAGAATGRCTCSTSRRRPSSRLCKVRPFCPSVYGCVRGSCVRWGRWRAGGLCDSIDVFGFSCAPPHTGHSKPVRGLAFAAGGHALLSASDDQRVNVHEMCVRDSVDKRRRVERRGPRLTDSSPAPPNQPTGAGTPWSRPTTGTRRGCWAWRPPPTAATSPRGALRWLWARERIVDWMAPSERYRLFTPRMNRQRGGPAREAVGPGHEGLRAHHRPVRWVRHDLMSTHSMHTTKPNPTRPGRAHRNEPHAHIHKHRHTEAVWSVAFNPAEPTQLASGSEDGSVLVHNLGQFLG